MLYTPFVPWCFLANRSIYTSNGLSGSYTYRFFGAFTVFVLFLFAIDMVTAKPISGRRRNNFMAFALLLGFAAMIFWLAPKLDHAQPGFAWRVPESAKYAK